MDARKDKGQTVVATVEPTQREFAFGTTGAVRVIELGKICLVQVKEMGKWVNVAKTDGPRFRYEAIEVCNTINTEIHDMALVRRQAKEKQ